MLLVSHSREQVYDEAWGLGEGMVMTKSGFAPEE